MKISVLLCLVLAACAEEKHNAYDGAQVERICRDGSYIYKYTDGSFHTNWGSVVTDPKTVCQ